MKKNKIKKSWSHKCMLLLVVVLTMGSCMSDTINLDPDKILEKDLNKDNLWGTYLTTMQRKVISDVVNDFQRSEDVFGNMYAGYFSGTQTWEGGNNGTTYVFPAHWLNTPFNIAFVEFLSSWNILRQKVDSTSLLFAVGEIVKVEALHKTCDMYGPLPYKKFGLVNPVPYDSQKDIYESFFKELDHAIDVLAKFDQINPNSKALAKFDLIYNSDIPKWIKFANSLKLRLAIRMRYVEPAIAQEKAEEALSHSYGVIEDNVENATLQDNPNLTFTFSNPMFNIWNGYGDDCMGATMDSYMNGYSDPRIGFYFQIAANDVYRGLRNGHRNGAQFRDQAGLSKPNILRGTPYHWITAAEVCFLRAEGAMLKWAMKGEAKDLYNQGIRNSFTLCGIQDEKIINSYLSNIVSKPADYPGFKTSPKISSPSNITIAWEDDVDSERKLERIITQKWIAIYPLGQEAWSEFRRTGYPKIFPIIDNLSSDINTNEQVRRIPFPESEYLGNSAEVDKAISLLGGLDSGATKLWWDAK